MCFAAIVEITEDKMTVIACYDETGNPYATKNERKGFCLLPWCYLWDLNKVAMGRS